jgi:hypothetical protein
VTRLFAKVKLLFATLALALSFPAFASDLPNPSLTPGAIDNSITQQNIQQTVCIIGYTKTIRPPASYTNNIKRQQLDTYYKGQGEMNSVEEDHLVPLIAGGHPTAIENLWPQSYSSEYDATYKDNCEVATGKAICNGSVKLLEAQQGFKINWIEWCKQLIGDTR